MLTCTGLGHDDSLASLALLFSPFSGGTTHGLSLLPGVYEDFTVQRGVIFGNLVFTVEFAAFVSVGGFRRDHGLRWMALTKLENNLLETI